MDITKVANKKLMEHIEKLVDHFKYHNKNLTKEQSRLIALLEELHKEATK